MQKLEKLIALVNHKNQIDIKRGEAKYMDTDWLLQAIISEIEEVRQEIKPNNAVYLEDELCDILWGWLTIIGKLQDRGYITSYDSILDRAIKKYEERILPLEGNANDHAIWKAVKVKQKQALEEESKC